MKITKTVKVPASKAVPAKPARTKKVQTLVCDFCNANVPSYGSFGVAYSCHICKRDICRKHTFFDGYDDHPDNFCPTCFELRFKKHAAEWYELQDRHEKEEDEFIKMIKKESLGE